MSEIDKLVSSVARAYLAVRGNTFNHLGVQLPLDQEVLTMAIQNNIVGAHLEEQKLLRRHGEAYRRYMARVPGLMPWPGRSLSQAEADDLIRLAADKRSDPSSADSRPKSR